MAVEMSVAFVQSVRSVSKMEIECMDSSNVLGIFCAFAMCSKAVARLSYIIDCHVRIRFLARRNSRASVGMWTVTVMKLISTPISNHSYHSHFVSLTNPILRPKHLNS